MCVFGTKRKKGVFLIEGPWQFLGSRNELGVFGSRGEYLGSRNELGVFGSRWGGEYLGSIRGYSESRRD